MQSLSKQELAAKLANKMTIELMELTQLSRLDCQHILTKQLRSDYTAQKPDNLSDIETKFIANLFH